MRDNLKFYVCDDNLEFANMIKGQIDLYMNEGRNYETTVFTKGVDLINHFDNECADVVLLDIDMPHMDGFEAAALLQNRKKDVFIIFVTSHEEKVYESYDYHPFWFVRKNHMHDLRVAVLGVLKKLDSEDDERELSLKLPGDKGNLVINVKTLLYIESCRNDIIIWDKEMGKRKVRCKISDIESQLYLMDIIRIQNGILVNCRFISKITSRYVILTNGVRLGLGRSRVNFTREQYQEFVRRTLI